MKRYLGWMVILMLVATAFYTIALDYGRPLPEYSPSTVKNAWLNAATVYHPDAFAYAGIGYQMLVKRTFNPHYYNNPSLNIYTDMFIFWISGSLALPHNATYGTREVAPFSVYVMAQFLSALFSVITVALVYSIGRMVFDRTVGFVAAALAAFSPLSVQHAHYATPNAETITMATAALLLAIVILKRRSPHWIIYIAAGLLVGLTMSARYNAVVVGVVTIAALVTAWLSHRHWQPVLMALVAMPIGFVIGTPGAIFAYRNFIDDVKQILVWYKVQGGGPGFTSNYGVYYHWLYTVEFVVGPVAILLALIGLGVALLRWRTSWQKAWVAGVFILYLIIYTILALPGKRLNANLLLPLIAPIALFAAYGGLFLWRRLKSGRQFWAVIGVVALLAWPVYLSICFSQLLATRDSRELAQAWIYQHVPKETNVELLGSYNIALDPLDYHFTNTYSGTAKLDDPFWQSDIIVYSDSSAFVTLRDRAVTENPDDITNTIAVADKLKNHWIELANFPRLYWPGQNTPPDDVSYWHQMGITVYCNPTKCPVSQPATGQ